MYGGGCCYNSVYPMTFHKLNFASINPTSMSHHLRKCCYQFQYILVMDTGCAQPCHFEFDCF